MAKSPEVKVTLEGKGKTKIARVIVDKREVQFTDFTKYKRASDVLCLIIGQPVSPHIKSEYTDHGAEIAAKMTLALKDNKIDPEKSSDKALLFIYEALGGGVRLHDITKKPKKGADSEDGETDESEETEEKDEEDDE